MSSADVIARSMAERDLLGHVRNTARMLDWLTYHTHRSDRSEPGFPDLVFIRMGVTLYAELKSEKGTVTEDQKAWLSQLSWASHRSAQAEYVIRPVHDGGTGLGVSTPKPWMDDGDCYPPMRTRLVRVYLWRPSHWRSGEIEGELR